MHEWPPATRSNCNDGTAASMWAANHRVTPSASMPRGTAAALVIPSSCPDREPVAAGARQHPDLGDELPKRAHGTISSVPMAHRPSEATMSVTFRRLADDDLPLMHRWLTE